MLFSDTMKILIDNNKIVEVSVNGISIPLKREIEVSELEELRKHLEYVEKYLDISRIMAKMKKDVEEGYRWNEDELKDFLKECPKSQKIFLKAMVDNENGASRDQINALMEKYTGEPLKRYSLPGIQSSMVRRSYNFGYKEKIWTSKDNLYTLKKKYRAIVKNFIENDGELK